MSVRAYSAKLLALVAALGLSTTALAKDFDLATLKQAKNPTFDLADVAGQVTFYDYMHATLGAKMLEVSSEAQPSSTNETVLKSGGGVSVKLGDHNYNVHINFPNRATGGRSYGWTDGQVGDWSDAMYLNNLAELVSEKDSADLAAFYSLVIRMLGGCDSNGIDSLNNQAQRVGANFLAIYTAEEYRAMVPSPNMKWDDAILQVTLLGAFHGGQSTFTKFYVGEFSATSRKQDSGVYNRGKPGPNFDSAAEKAAEMNDYWQFSANPTSKQSGINITRNDFEKMGTAITKFEADNASLKKIQAIVGDGGGNIFKAIAAYFTTGKADVKKAAALAKAVAQFEIDIRNDAEEITNSLK